MSGRPDAGERVDVFRRVDSLEPEPIRPRDEGGLIEDSEDRRNARDSRPVPELINRMSPGRLAELALGRGSERSGSD